MIRFLRWLGWSAWYLVRRRPRDFDGYLRAAMRCRPPWWKFRPNVYHNQDGCMWQVYLVDEQSYTERRTLTLDVMVGMETGRITGLDLWDEQLELRR